MAIAKQLHELTIEEINDELEFIGDKARNRLDHARSAIKKAFDKGNVTYTGPDPFYDEAKVEAAKAAAKEVAKAEKPAKAEKKPATMVWLDSHERVGQRAFTRFGHNTIKRVGYRDTDTYNASDDSTFGVLRAELDTGDIVTLTSCRSTAVRDEYRERYPTFEQKTPSGKKAIGVEDRVTEKLVGLTTAELKAIAAECGIDYTWDHLNPGMQRMCLGNKIRGNLKKGQRVVMLGEVLCEGPTA